MTLADNQTCRCGFYGTVVIQNIEPAWKYDRFAASNARVFTFRCPKCAETFKQTHY